MVVAIDDKIYVNIIKENTEIQQTFYGQRDKFRFQFFHILGITKDYFLDDIEHYKLSILLFYGHGTQDSYLGFQDGNGSTSLISRILLISSQSLFHKKIIMRKIA